MTNNNLAMSSSTSSNADPHSDPEQSEDTSQPHTVHPQNKYEWLTTFTIGLFQWVFLPVLQALVAVIIIALGDRQPIIDGHEQQANDIANNIPSAHGTPHDPSNPSRSSRQAGLNSLSSISEPATTPVTQLQDAQGFPTEDRQPITDGHQQECVDITNDVPQIPRPHDSSNPPSRQAEGRNPLPNTSEPATILVATQLQGAQGFTTEDRQLSIDGHQQQASVDIANDIPRAHVTPHHGLSNPPSMQAEGPNPLSSISELAIIPVATQFQGARDFTIGGNPVWNNIGRANNVTTVNNYGGTHGLEKLENHVSFAALHDSAEQDPTRRCHPGTRNTILSQLRDWFDNPNATEPICWLYGPAGAGKSAIAQTIAKEYIERGLAATFFFYRSDAERNNGNRLFPTIAWQLAFSIPPIKDLIVRALDKTPHLPKKNVETQFNKLVAYPFQPTNNIAFQLPQSAPVVIIDGVDECSDEQLQRRILTVIGNAVKDCSIPLHFLICSRPEALIEEALDPFKDITLRIDLATLDDSNRDIEKYLVDQFSAIRSKRDLASTWPGQETIEEFVFKSSGYFVFAATVMRCISDEECDPEEQLDIVRNLKPRGKMSPFALLNELYLEILKRQRDQDFLKTFLGLFVGRSSIKARDLHEDDATLMNVSEKKLHLKLRKMRSLLKFEPFIDVHHKSFLDFLYDPSRSGQYHVSEQGGQKRYLELIVDRVVRHVSMAIEQPNGHEKCRSKPKFRNAIEEYPPMMVLPDEDWQETLKPLVDLQDKLLNTLKPQPCGFFQAMRELLLHLLILQGNHHIAAAQVLESDIDKTVTECSPTLVTEARQNPPENDLDRCLSVLLETNSALTVDTVMIESMSFLLAFDGAETVARIRSVTNAQKLIDLIDLLIHNEAFLSQCGRDAVRKAALLASDIYARVPLLPRSVFLKGPTPQQFDLFPDDDRVDIEIMCQTMFISRFLDHDHIIPLFLILQGDKSNSVYDHQEMPLDALSKWLERTSPTFLTRIRVMLEVAKTIRYIHAMGVFATLFSEFIDSDSIVLDSNLHAKVFYGGAFSWLVREDFLFEGRGTAELTPEHNISAFAALCQKVCFDDDDDNHPNHLAKDAKQLIKRCGAEDPKSRPSMEDVVKEMETWDLT